MPRKRRAQGLGHITATEVKKIEKLMQWQHDEVEDARAKHDPDRVTFERHLLQGMSQAADTLGIKCNCSYPDIYSKKAVCLCSRTTAGLSKKISDRTGINVKKPRGVVLLGSSLSGAGSRRKRLKKRRVV